MSAAILLAELEYAGIRLRLDGLYVVADVLPEADLDLYRELIAEHKPELMAELTPLPRRDRAPRCTQGRQCQAHRAVSLPRR